MDLPGPDSVLSFSADGVSSVSRPVRLVTGLRRPDWRPTNRIPRSPWWRRPARTPLRSPSRSSSRILNRNRRDRTNPSDPWSPKDWLHRAHTFGYRTPGQHPVSCWGVGGPVVRLLDKCNTLAGRRSDTGVGVVEKTDFFFFFLPDGCAIAIVNICNRLQ